MKINRLPLFILVVFCTLSCTSTDSTKDDKSTSESGKTSAEARQEPNKKSPVDEEFKVKELINSYPLRLISPKEFELNTSVTKSEIFTPEDSKLDIYVFSMGQADATLIVTNQHTILIDSGEPVTGSKTNYIALSRELKRIIPSKSIDLFIVSHYHTDHIGNNGNGLDGLITKEGFTFGAIMLPDPEAGKYFTRRSTHDFFIANYEKWKSNNLVQNYLIAQPFDIYELDIGITMEVITSGGKIDNSQNSVLKLVEDSNQGLYAYSQPSENDLSVSLVVKFGDFEFFTGGDLTGSSNYEGFGDAFKIREFGGNSRQTYTNIEGALASYYRSNNIEMDVEVYRVNHHGSENSSHPSFMKLLDPEVLIYSTGGAYGHPSRKVIETGYSTGYQFITSGVSQTSWPDIQDIETHNAQVVGTISIQVQPDSSYLLNGVKFKSFSDDDERAGLDEVPYNLD